MVTSVQNRLAEIKKLLADSNADRILGGGYGLPYDRELALMIEQCELQTARAQAARDTIDALLGRDEPTVADVGSFDFDSLPTLPEALEAVATPKPCFEALPPRKATPTGSGIKWTPAIDNAMSPVAGTLEISTARHWSKYTVSEFPADFAGRGFHLRKLTAGSDPTEEAYSVFIPKCGPGALCECKGFYFAGHCKHIDAIQALLGNRWI